MRVTGGRYRGRTVKCPKGVIRPTMDRMRESLFNILGTIEGESFLDLFSGSGVVAHRSGLPGRRAGCAGREGTGANGRYCFRTSLIVESPIYARIMSAQRFLKDPGDPFDYIYLDPPLPPGRQGGLHRSGREETGQGRAPDDPFFPEEDDPGTGTGQPPALRSASIRPIPG